MTTPARFGVAAVCVALLATRLPASGTATPVPENVRAEIEASLAKKIHKLAEEKDEVGASYKHGSYFKNFKPVGTGYELTFFVRISKADELVTERYRVRVEPDSGSTWKIVDEKLEDSVSGILFRSVPRDETFHSFDSFSFNREGMELHGGKGALVMDYWRGKPFRITVEAEGLHYDYQTPPGVDLPWMEDVLRKQVAKHPGDIVFAPEHVVIECDAASCGEIIAASFTGLRTAAIEVLSSKLRTDYDDFLRELEKARREEPLAGFRRVPRPEDHNWRVGVKRVEGDHWAWLSYDTDRPREVEFTVTKLGLDEFYGFPLFAYYSDATRKGGVNAYDLEKRDDSGARDYDLKGFQGSVKLGVDTPEMMNCDFTYTMTAKRDFKELPFYVSQLRRRPGDKDTPRSPTLMVETMEDGSGRPLTYVRLGAAFGFIVFPDVVKAGDELVLHVQFDNDKSIYAYNQSYSRVSRQGWAPFVTLSDKIDTFDITITVLDKYQILGIDNRVSDTVANGLRTARYTSNFPLTFPTIIFGDYTCDTPRTAAKKPDGSPIDVRVCVDKTSMMGNTRPMVDGSTTIKDVINHYRQEAAHGIRDIRQDALRPIAEEAVNAINLYQEIFGVPYPFRKMDLVDDPLGGFYGQAPPSIVYLGFGVFWPKAKVAEMTAEDISSFQNTVVAHEIGHQWWGSTVVNSNQGNYWFVESLAEYSSALYEEALAQAGEKDPERAAKKSREAYMRNVEEWRRTILKWPDMFTSVQLSDTMQPGGDVATRTAAIYNKGPFAFHMLRLTFGDEKFFKFLKELAQELQRKEIVTLDIQRVAEHALGGVDENGKPYNVDLTWFFDQWIRGVGIPQFSINYTTRRTEEGAYVVEGKLKQRVVLGRDKIVLPGKLFRGVASITVTGKDKKEYGPVRIPINNSEESFRFKVPVEPLEVTLNKGLDMLSEDVLVNRSW